MPEPKRRHSKARRNKRRTQDNLKRYLLERCNRTGVRHRAHHVYRCGNDLCYAGQVFLKDFFTASKK